MQKSSQYIRLSIHSYLPWALQTVQAHLQKFLQTTILIPFPLGFPYGLGKSGEKWKRWLFGLRPKYAQGLTNPLPPSEAIDLSHRAVQAYLRTCEFSSVLRKAIPVSILDLTRRHAHLKIFNRQYTCYTRRLRFAVDWWWFEKPKPQISSMDSDVQTQDSGLRRLCHAPPRVACNLSVQSRPFSCSDSDDYGLKVCFLLLFLENTNCLFSSH